MARKKAHEDHVNHEAWAIPYGDMLVLLLALFVVMYAVSSVNEGKYRVLADSLNAEFSGAPRSVSPIQFGSKQTGSEVDSRSSMMRMRASQTAGGPVSKNQDPRQTISSRLPMPLKPTQSLAVGSSGGAGGNAAGARLSAMADARAAAERRNLQAMGEAIKGALGDLVKRDLVRVRATSQTLEVEIRADILYPSGSAQLVAGAHPILDKLADILAKFPNALRVEGHTDSLPINSSVFPSNWELSAARAASVVHRFTRRGIAASRLSVVGFAEFRPVADNGTIAGRNRNRRVLMVVLARQGEALPFNDAPAEPADPRAAEAKAGPAPGTVHPRSTSLIGLPDMHPQVSMRTSPPPAAATAATH